MKVLMINSVCGIRSTGRICTDIAELLEGKGYECKIAYGREDVPEKYQKYAVKIGNNLSVRLDALKSRCLDNAGFNSRLATKKFIKWVEEYNPDVIHLHNLHGYYLNIEILFKYLKTCGKKIVWTMHDCWAFTGHCAYFDSIGCNKWEKGCEYCLQKKKYPQSLLLDKSKLNYQKKRELFTNVSNMIIVTPSRWLANLISRSFLKQYEIQVIPNGIDVNIFQPMRSDLRERYALQNKQILLGVASTWNRYKGLNDFIELSKHLEEQYQIVLIGVSKAQLKMLPPQVIGIERTNNVKELAQWYSTADVFLNLTYEDNYPTVNLEAQACGTPVITYATGGSVESVPSTGVVDKGNLDQIRALLSMPQREWIKELYTGVDKNTYYSKYIKIYEE